MNKKLPKVFQNKIDKDVSNNNKFYYSVISLKISIRKLMKYLHHLPMYIKQMLRLLPKIPPSLQK